MKKVPDYRFGFDLHKYVEKPRPIDPTSLVEQVLGSILVVLTGAWVFGKSRRKGG